jgi:small nuclear ribonucleoprotein (snRNP)-like protein
MNIVLDDAVEEKNGGEKVGLGMVVCLRPYQLALSAVSA